jgi:hypothetical protein
MRSWRLEELPRLLGGGQRADDIQVDAPDEHAVGAHVGRLNAQLCQLGENQLVDGGIGRCGGAVKGILRRGRTQGAQSRQQDNRSSQQSLRHRFSHFTDTPQGAGTLRPFKKLYAGFRGNIPTTLITSTGLMGFGWMSRVPSPPAAFSHSKTPATAELLRESAARQVPRRH